MELKLSTDQDCALIMERLLHSMGDWGRRVVADSFAGQYVFLTKAFTQPSNFRQTSWNLLIQHRFGSHVCQTLFSLAADTIDREASFLGICSGHDTRLTNNPAVTGKRHISQTAQRTGGETETKS
jgi:hypothetical protein